MIVPFVNASLVINEIMYNPPGADGGHEWIEIFNNGVDNVDMEGYIFFENDQNHRLNLVQGDSMVLSSSEYAVIADNAETFLQDYENYTGILIDSVFFLSNSGEYISLRDQEGNILDELEYSQDWGGNENERTICLLNNEWRECVSTPGKENVEYQEPIHLVERIIDGDTFVLENGERVRMIGINTPERGEYYYENSQERLAELIEGKQVLLEGDKDDRDDYRRLLRYVYFNGTFVNLIMVEEGFAKAFPYGNNREYESVFADAEMAAINNGYGIWSPLKNIRITEFMYNPLGNDDGQEWIELYVGVPINLSGFIIQDGNSEDYLRQLKAFNSSYALIVEEGFDYGDVPASVYSAGITIGNSLGNSEDIISIRYAQGDTIDFLRYYSDWGANDNGMSLCKLNNFWRECSATMGYENLIQSEESSSTMDIENVYLGNDNKAKFGDLLRIKIKIYKGNTEKYNIGMYLVDENKNQLSKRSQINVDDKFTVYTLVVPLQIEPNCNRKYPDGRYEIVLEGLDDSDAEEIEIEGITPSLCETIKIQEESQSLRNSPIQEQVNLEEPSQSSIYQSSDIKAKNGGIYFFCAVLLLLVIYLIFKKSL